MPTLTASLFLPLALASTLLLFSTPLPAQSPAPNSVATAQILLQAVDTTGAPAKTLTKDTIQLQIDGHTVDTQDVLPLATSPLYFSVLVDVSGSTRDFAAAQSAAVTKLFSLLSTDDRNRGYLVPFKDGLHPHDQPIAAADVNPAMESFTPRVGSTNLFDWLVHVALKQVRAAQIPKNARRAIFVFTDGDDNSSQHSLVETLKILEREGTPIFAIWFSNSTESYKSRKQGLETLRSLTQATGGSLFSLNQPGSIEQATDAQYLLTFTAPQLKPQKPYPLKITSTDQSIRITAPQHYVAP